MRIVFWGAPQFAVPTLRRLVASEYQVVAAVTHPDRPRGRGRRPAPTAVKAAAAQLGLTVVEPASTDAPELVTRLRELNADLYCVVAFSILPRAVLDLPRLGAVNLHPSMLPRYRGAAPIIWAIIRGEQRTGITTFRLNARIDAGDVLLQRQVDIGPDETAGELEARLAEVGADMMLETVEGLATGTVPARPQPAGQATRAPKLTREDARLDWAQPAPALRNLIRGTNPVPGAYTTWRGATLKVHRAEVVCLAAASPPAPGTVVEAAPQSGLVVATGAGALRLTEVQPQGGTAMKATAFLRGHPISVGERLGGDAG